MKQYTNAFSSSGGTTFNPGCSQEHPDLNVVSPLITHALICKHNFYHLETFFFTLVHSSAVKIQAKANICELP